MEVLMATRKASAVAGLLLLTAALGRGLIAQKAPREDFDCGKCDGSGGGLHSIINAGGKCLDVDAPNMRNDGGQVQVWDCTGKPEQKWQWRGTAIVNAGGKCLDVDAPAMRSNGARVQVWGCNGQPQQQWRMQGRALINAGGMCLDVHAPDIQNNGGRVQVWTCVGGAQPQDWKFVH
jgi:predicted secreted protein